MIGDVADQLPEPGAGTDCLTPLRSLTREEILDLLSEGLCHHCQLHIADLASRKLGVVANLVNGSTDKLSTLTNSKGSKGSKGKSSSMQKSASESGQQESSSWSSGRVMEREYVAESSPSSVTSKHASIGNSSSSQASPDVGLSKALSAAGNGLSENQKEQLRISQIRRKKDFVYSEKVNGRMTNVVQGLELHIGVFNPEEQKTIVECVYDLQRMGQKGQLRERTYTEPRKWMRGKGRVTIQFGCCYNYAMDKDGNPPGIIRDEEVDPLPTVFKQMIKRMVRWQVLPPTCIPNSCIVNIYDEGDCIPPHIDHHDFLRPFCTVSFLAECNILFGSNLKILSPGQFSGPVSIPLPLGSVLILNGNGADVAKHCVPSVPAKRISITFRRMDDSKLPYKFLADPDLVGIKPFTLSHHHEEHSRNVSALAKRIQNDGFVMGKDDFPPLGSTKSGKQATPKSGQMQRNA